MPGLVDLGKCFGHEFFRRETVLHYFLKLQNLLHPTEMTLFSDDLLGRRGRATEGLEVDFLHRCRRSNARGRITFSFEISIW